MATSQGHGGRREGCYSQQLFVCSHLSNKRGFMIIDFDFFPPSKHISTLHAHFHPPRTFPPSTFIDFLDFFHPPLLIYCSYVLVSSKKKPPSMFIPTSTFIDFTTFAPPPRLFQPPCLLILQLLHPLHIYSNLLGY